MVALAVLAALAVPLVVPPVAEMLIVRQLRALGVTVRPTLTLGYCWRNGPGVQGQLKVSVPGTMALAAAGCFTVKTESEVKPIHITLDINLKVDKEIDKAFSDENLARPAAASGCSARTALGSRNEVRERG